MEEKKPKDLKIPTQVSDRADIIQGIGKKELGIIGGAVVFLIIFVIVFTNITGNVAVGIFSAMFLLAVVIVTIKRDTTNENLIDHTRNLIRYLRMQKIYEYRYYDIYSAYMTREEENAKE